MAQEPTLSSLISLPIMDFISTNREGCGPDADPCPPQLGWDIVLETKDDGYENEFQYLALWSEKTYHTIVDEWISTPGKKCSSRNGSIRSSVGETAGGMDLIFIRIQIALGQP